MDNIKAGVPRTAYRGIVTTWLQLGGSGGAWVKVHIVPDSLPLHAPPT
jgi:hypothetical protein